MRDVDRKIQEATERALAIWNQQPEQYRLWALRKVKSTIRRLRQQGVIE